MAITRSDELRHSPAARDTKSSSRVISNHYPLIEKKIVHQNFVSILFIYYEIIVCILLN
jgi:hypothetical protein